MYYICICICVYIVHFTTFCPSRHDSFAIIFWGKAIYTLNFFFFMNESFIKLSKLQKLYFLKNLAMVCSRIKSALISIFYVSSGSNVMYSKGVCISDKPTKNYHATLQFP